VGALYTYQRGLVHEQSLVLAAEYGEIALKTVCAAFPGGRRIVFMHAADAASDT